MNIVVYLKPFDEKEQLENDGIACTNISENDRAAIEAALRQKQKTGATVIAFAVGDETADTQLREAFAMGADDAVLFQTSGEEAANALVIASALKKLRADCYITGKVTDLSLIERVAKLAGFQITDANTDEVPVSADNTYFALASAEAIKPRYMQIAGIYTAYRRKVRQLVF
ncbi:MULTISPECIES: hypothetical protein [unclassified Sporolactobacillus]|uniref:hypothetical protein n=1 Tax=unclassified Sporolactobacillus TaxID=2628533 RepID=UPI002368CD0C|nr:hypothetical protein [Sporolactobacillus sp. CQH2019]MDD9149191.1 hypothetical protein [Sporolactobacillus sp. CQH2019]